MSIWQLGSIRPTAVPVHLTQGYPMQDCMTTQHAARSPVFHSLMFPLRWIRRHKSLYNTVHLPPAMERIEKVYICYKSHEKEQNTNNPDAYADASLGAGRKSSA